MIYGAEGTQALFTVLATQIVYSGCDRDTADFKARLPVGVLPMLTPTRRKQTSTSVHYSPSMRLLHRK